MLDRLDRIFLGLVGIIFALTAPKLEEFPDDDLPPETMAVRRRSPRPKHDGDGEHSAVAVAIRDES